MAFVDFLSTKPEQRLSRFSYGVRTPQEMHPNNFRPPTSFCQRCYGPSFSPNGLCLNCSAFRPSAPPPVHAIPRPDTVLPPSADYGDLTSDRFMMSHMLHVVNDVLKEQDEKLPTPDDVVPDGPHAVGLSGPLGPPGTASPQFTPCGKCGSDHVAYCIECQDFLCTSCATAHENTAPTKDHRVIDTPATTASQTSSRRISPPGPSISSTISTPISASSMDHLPSFDEDEYRICDTHSPEKLSLFCPMCIAIACKKCASSNHAHHNCMTLREAYIQFKPAVRELLGKTQVEVNMLDLSYEAAENMSKSIVAKQKEAVAGVHAIFLAHREALVQREQEVVAQINAIADLRLDALAREKESIQTSLKALKSLSSTAESTLDDGNTGGILIAHLTLSDKLQSCHKHISGKSPVEDDSFILKSNASAAQSALKSLCKLTTAPYPPLCTAMGEGLFHPRVNRLCTVILCTKDRAGEPCVEGGERLFVQLKSVGGGGVLLPVDIRDNQDGSYSINFRPRLKGEHQLVIAIRGQHIQGSPFTLLVDGGREYGRFGMVTQVFGSEGSQNGQFCRPWGICCDQQGNIIVGDRSNHRVQIFDSNGVFKHKFGSEGVRPGQFNRPAGVAVTREGHIVVADKDNHRIQVLKIDGTFLFMFGSKGGNDGQMIYPYDVAVNQIDGRIAVTDTGNHRLLIFSHDGVLLGKFGYKGYLCGHFDSPRGIAFNDDGHIIVSDFNVHHILVIHPDGTTARILGSQGSGNGQFMRPQGIAVDHMGNFVVSDTRNNRVVIMHPSGHFIAKFGIPGCAPGQFDRPTSVAVLPDGRITVVDFGNARIQVF